MFKKFELTFPPKVADFVKETYQNAQLIVEYGSGGSTLFAAQVGKKILSVESDIQWLMELMASYKEAGLPGDIVPLWANIGKTENWGYPDNEAQWKTWPTYAKLPWQFCQEHTLNPDIVLIDGRFRVACFIASCMAIKKTTTLLFDDYVERSHYHCVNHIVKPDTIIDNRMAVFTLHPNMIDGNYLLQHLEYFYEPE